MPDKDESKQQALENLRSALGRCKQEGFPFELREVPNHDVITITIWNVNLVDSNQTLRLIAAS